VVGWGNFDDRLPFRRWLLLVIGNILLAVLCMLALPTVTWWVGGGFTPQTMFQSTSPDGRHRIAVATRIAFPANEFFDPSIMVDISLSNPMNGEVLDSVSVELFERSDFGNPTADWTADTVTLRDIYNRRGLTLTMALGEAIRR
jgi:hypothetical protein